MITMFWPYVPEEAISAVSEVLRGRWIGQGPKVDEVEKIFGEKFSIPYSVTVHSGTAALHLALKLCDLKEGDEVITTPMTCTATNIPILYSKSKAVFADIQENSMNIDPKDIEKRITPKTKAIMVVHWAGYPCDMAEINAIAKKYNLKVIEDAAHALGAKYQGKYIGAVSDYTCFSFQAIKQITSIDGGMLTALRENDYKRAKILRWYGIDREFKGDIYWKYQIKEIGYKYHMNDVTATILEVQLSKLEQVLKKRKAIADKYLEGLKNIGGLKLLERNPDRESGNWLFTIQVEKRDDFQKKLTDHDIESHMVHVRNDICPIFGGQRQELPIMNKLEGKYISIPLHNHLSDEDIDKVIKVIKSGW
ncbi:DegT/DnrJ/EryC1/StrS family aminotransferase, partial [Candidatus Parcubacteria bacterium]